jgi:threonine dehydrogenase-like Zn-dependent dehydrogenase
MCLDLHVTGKGKVMKAALLDEDRGPEKLRYNDSEMPKPGDTGVLVRVRATSLNPIDYKIRSGARAFEIPIAKVMKVAEVQEAHRLAGSHAIREKSFWCGDAQRSYSARKTTSKSSRLTVVKMMS